MSEFSPEFKNRPTHSLTGEGQPVWPPAPKQPRPNVLYTGGYGYGGGLVTGFKWLDVVLAIPSGFILGLLLLVVVAACLEAVHPPPLSSRQELLETSLGALLTAIAYLLIGRKFVLFAAVMWIGGVPFYLLLFLMGYFIGPFSLGER